MRRKKKEKNTPVRKSEDITPQSRKCVAVVKYTWLGWWMSIMARRWALTKSRPPGSIATAYREPGNTATEWDLEGVWLQIKSGEGVALDKSVC
jgi:hypothetical protein